MSSGLYSGQPGLSLGTGLYRTVSGLWSGASGLAMAFGGAGMSLSLDFLTMTAYTLDPRITFSRGSQAMVTDATGKLTYAPNNLLTNSESFEAAAWAKTNATVTANTVAAPDGTTTADTLAATNANATALQTFTATGATYIYSVYIRRKTGTGNIDITVDGTTYATKSVTSSWVRYDTLLTPAAGSKTAGVRIATSGDEVYIWGAQLEAVTYQTTPSPYVSTTPKNLLGYTQEFGNAAWTKSNAFVQTNLLTYSEDFTNAAWSKFAATVTGNVVTAPNGTLTADKIAEDATTAYHFAREQLTVASGVQTFSVYVKAAERTKAVVSITDLTTGDASVGVDLTNGTTFSTGLSVGSWTNISSTVTPVGDGWYRVTITGTRNAGTQSGTVVAPVIAAGSTSYAGTAGSGIYAWGAQLVQGSTAGDYQRTDAAAAAVQYVAPDGSRTADKLVETTSTSSHGTTFGSSPLIVANTPISVSLYVKPEGRNLRVTAYTATNGLRATFNFSTQTVTNGSYGNSTYTSGTMTALADGWYRISLIGIPSSTEANPTYAFEMLNGTTLSYAGDGNSGLFLWGAQLSNSASLDPYVYNPVAAPSSTAYYGPRFDYDPVTLAPKGLLIEEQRTNLLTYSEQFDNAAWTKNAATITANATTSPDGTSNADKVIADATNNFHNVAQNFTISATTAYAFSIYVKAGEYTFAAVETGGSGGAGWSTRTAVVNLSTGALVSESVTGMTTIANAGNGWYRVTVQTATSTGAGTPGFRCYAMNSGTFAAFTGDGTSGVFAWGAQLEAGSFSTSYIPTVASTVTRSADVALMQAANFSNWYNLNAGTFVVQATPYQVSTTNGIFSANDGSSNNRIDFRNTSVGFVTAGGVTQASFSTSTLSTAVDNKIGVAYSQNDFAAIANAGTLSTDTSGAVPVVSRLLIGALDTGSNYLNGHIRSIQYYNTRLPNLQLQALTS